jgi:hypothetical protein
MWLCGRFRTSNLSQKPQILQNGNKTSKKSKKSPFLSVFFLRNCVQIEPTKINKQTKNQIKFIYSGRRNFRKVWSTEETTVWLQLCFLVRGKLITFLKHFRTQILVDFFLFLWYLHVDPCAPWCYSMSNSCTLSFDSVVYKCEYLFKTFVHLGRG